MLLGICFSFRGPLHFSSSLQRSIPSVSPATPFIQGSVALILFCLLLLHSCSLVSFCSQFVSCSHFVWLRFSQYFICYIEDNVRIKCGGGTLCVACYFLHLHMFLFLHSVSVLTLVFCILLSFCSCICILLHSAL